jgi:hypothetical protein
MTDFHTDPAILAAAEALTELGEITEYSASETWPTSMEDALAHLANYGVPAVLEQVGCELAESRVGQGWWKEMKLDLLEKPDGRVFPIDYLPAVAPELALYYKGEGKADLETVFLSPLDEVADALDIPPVALVTEHSRVQVDRYLRKFAARIRQCILIRETLRVEMAKQAQIGREAKAELNRIHRRDFISQLMAERQTQSQDHPTSPEAAVS